MRGKYSLNDSSMPAMAASIVEFFRENIFISPEDMYPSLRDAVQETASPRNVVEIDTGVIGDDAASDAFRTCGHGGDVLIIRCPHRLPRGLRVAIRAFYKDEFLPRKKGDWTVPDSAAQGFSLLLWMTPEAYLDMDEIERSQLAEAAPYIFYYPEDPNKRRDSGELSASRRAIEDDPIRGLKALGSDEERRRTFLATFPPKPGRGFEGFDEEMEKLIESAARDGDSRLHSFLISIFAEQDDYYLIHRSFDQGLEPDRASADRAARALVSAEHLGGQKQAYWNALGSMSSHPEVRRFLTGLLDDCNNRPIEAENALLVLEKVQPWPDLEDTLENVSHIAQYDVIRHKAEKLLKLLRTGSWSDEDEKSALRAFLDKVFRSKDTIDDRED